MFAGFCFNSCFIAYLYIGYTLENKGSLLAWMVPWRTFNIKGKYFFQMFFFFFSTQQQKRFKILWALWGTQNDYSICMASLWKPYFGSFIFKSVGFRFEFKSKSCHPQIIWGWHPHPHPQYLIFCCRSWSYCRCPVSICLCTVCYFTVKYSWKYQSSNNKHREEIHCGLRGKVHHFHITIYVMGCLTLTQC